MKTVRENIEAGKYTNHFPFGSNTNDPNWREVRDAYYEEDKRVLNLFREDLEAEYGTANYAKKDKLYALAWEYGHSSGLNEVLGYYGDLSEIIDLKG